MILSFISRSGLTVSCFALPISPADKGRRTGNKTRLAMLAACAGAFMDQRRNSESWDTVLTRNLCSLSESSVCEIALAVTANNAGGSS